MFGILFIIFVIVGVGIIFEGISKRRGEKPTFWHTLWESLSLKAIAYFFNTSNAKVVVQFIRCTTWVCASAMFGWPAINGLISSNNSGSQIFFSLEWESYDTYIILLYLILNGVVLAVYLINNKGKQQLIEEDKRIIEDTKNISEQTHILVKQNNQGIAKLLEIAQRDVDGTIHHLLSNIIDEVKSLKLITAHKNLLILKEEAERICPENIELKSSIYLWLGICGKYTNIPECTSFFESAYESLNKNGKNVSEEILSGKIFTDCVKGRFESAKQLAELLIRINPSNPWAYIPAFYIASSKQEYLYNLKNNSSISIRDVIKESCLLFQINDCLNDIKLVEIEPSIPDALSIENLSEWILSLYIAIDKFAQTTFYTFDGRDYKTVEVESLFKISSRFLELAHNTEIESNLPDIPLYQAISGYLYTKEYSWIQVLESLNVRSEVRANQIMALSVGYYEQGNIDKALTVLSDYQSFDSIGIVSLRAVLLLRCGKFGELGNLLTKFISQSIQLPSTHYGLIFNIVKCAPTLASIAEKVIVQKQDQRLFNEFVRALGGLNPDINFILAQKSIPKPFKYHYPIILFVLGEKNLAYNLLSQEISLGVLDGRGLIYIELLKELGHKSELYRYLQSLRKNNIIMPNLLIEELHYAERLHYYKDAVDITGLLLAERPNDSEIIMHRLMSLHYAKESNAVILDFFEKTRNHNYSILAITNITAILFNRGLFKECVEFLYNQIIHCNNQELKDLYFCYHTNPNIRPIIEEEHDTVCFGDYILYVMDGKDVWDEVVANSNLENLVGKKIGDTVMIAAGYKDKQVIIKGIWTKYFKLLREVILSIHSNKSKTIWSVTIDDLGPNILDGMASLVDKYNGGKKELSQQERTDEYNNGERPLISFIRRHAPFHSICSLLFGEFEIHNVSEDLHILNGNLSKDLLSRMNLVLDLTSCMLIAEISLSLNLVWDKKFIIPKSLLDLIDFETTQLQNQAINEILPSNIFNRMTVTNNLDEHPLVVYFKWIKENCEVETDNRKLDINSLPNNDEIVDCFLESRLLADNSNRILLSEDAYINQHLNNLGYSMGSEAILRIMFPNKTADISQKLFDYNYVGISLHPSIIFNEYQNYIAQEHNKFELCIKNLKINPLNWQSFFKASMMFLSGLYTQDNIRHATNLLLIIFESLGPHMTLKFYNYIYSELPECDIKHCLEDAFRVYSSTHVIL